MYSRYVGTNIAARLSLAARPVCYGNACPEQVHAAVAYLKCYLHTVNTVNTLVNYLYVRQLNENRESLN